MKKNTIKIATLDLYNNERNEGMRCIRDLVFEAGHRFAAETDFDYQVFETRYKGDIPAAEDFDIFISSGGPGSPFEDEGKKWETEYFNLLDTITNFNVKTGGRKKYIFFICHSFQLMARHFQFAEVSQRHKKSFGIFPFHRTPEGDCDSLLKDLTNPFFAADFRQFQVTQPNPKALTALNAKIISTEIDTDDGFEPAVMAVRISAEIVGTQFHPEADPDSMIYHFRQKERKEYIVSEFGEQMYFTMLTYLEDAAKIPLTRKSVIPSFLDAAFSTLLSQQNSELRAS